MRTIESQVDSLLARSVLWQALAHGLAPPDDRTRARFAVEGTEALAAAALSAGLALDPQVHALAAGAPDPADHARIFGHTSRGAVPPYETEWGRDNLFLKPQELADLNGFLAAFGLRLDPNAHERVDSLVIEAELMAFLLAREARALERGEDEAREVARGAARRLLKDHIARFAPAFARALATAGGDAFYGGLGAFAHALVAAECERAEIAPGSDATLVRPTEIDDLPVDCGGGDELIQIEKAGAGGQRA